MTTEPASVFLRVLLVAVPALAGCAAAASEESDSATGAIQGSPGTAFDRDKRDAEKNRASAESEVPNVVYEEYRAAAASALREVTEIPDWFRCELPAPPAGARTFTFETERLTRKLQQAELASTVYVVEKPASGPYVDVEFLVRRGPQRGCVARVALACTAVSPSDGPTREQCGLAPRR